MLAKYACVPVDYEKPRDSRLKVALKLDQMGNKFAACEAMTGDPPHKRNDYAYLIMAQAIDGKSPEEFYKGFPDVDKVFIPEA